MHEAQPFSNVFVAELDHVRISRGRRKVGHPVAVGGEICNRALDSGLMGVALSGGGIRSATLALGVLQGLADRGLIRQADYLSTVSGGGYMGSWFISRLKRHGGPEQVQDVEKMLTPEHTCRPDDDDQWPIHFLRQYSNYLTPRLGFLSADVWTMAATWFRNTLLNLLMLVAAIGALLTLPRLAGLAFAVPGPVISYFSADAAVAVLFLTLGNWHLCDGLRPGPNWTQGMVLRRILVPFLVASIFLTRWLWFSSRSCRPWFHSDSFWTDALRNWIAVCILFAVSAFFSGMWAAYRKLHPRQSTTESLCWIAAIGVAASVLPAFVVFLGLRETADYLKHFQYAMIAPWMLWTWGPPAMIGLLSLGVILQIGLLGLAMELDAREWLARLGAWAMIFSLTWIVVVGGSVYGPWLLLVLGSTHPWTKFGLTGAWLATTTAGVLSGKSAKSSGESGTLKAGSGGGKPSVELIARVAPFVFMAGFVLLIAFGIHVLTAPGGLNTGEQTKPANVTINLSAESAGSRIYVSAAGAGAAAASEWVKNPEEVYFKRLRPEWHWTNWAAGSIPVLSNIVWLLAVLAGSAVLLSLQLDINVFSLHEFYKNRLVRCYLGATRDPNTDRRQPDRFTGFSSKDEMKLADFSARSGGYYGPYPLMNATMNISSGQDLGWQERKSAPFLFSPLYCGYDVGKGNRRMRLGSGARYKDASEYAYRPTAELCHGTGIELGTAMAVSGAAASPNQGYHTSTAVAFLMTAFDVRLGLWVGNPRRNKKYRVFSPQFNLATLAMELFGLTNAEAGFVNLSDGGHFDNMGLYELVRRRCRYIILSDGEQDAEMIFGSLTTTIRNCRTDFGVEIKIALDRIAKNERGFSTAHCVVGSIEYPEDAGRPEKEKRPGYLLYLKSSLTGDEPADVTGYHVGHPEFPHQSTGDQWFTERQFEAYRKLGQHIVQTAIGSVRAEAADREKFFNEVQSLWYPPSVHVEKNSARHAELFADLTLPFGAEDRLAAMDPQLFEGWATESARLDRWQRESVYRVSALIQFMKIVYSDLNLESKSEREHPHNQGWLRIFEYWVRQPAFQETWERISNMYSDRFQAFYNDRLKAATRRKT
jgi:hypothetical protein